MPRVIVVTPGLIEARVREKRAGDSLQEASDVLFGLDSKLSQMKPLQRQAAWKRFHEAHDEHIIAMVKLAQAEDDAPEAPTEKTT